MTDIPQAKGLDEGGILVLESGSPPSNISIEEMRGLLESLRIDYDDIFLPALKRIGSLTGKKRELKSTPVNVLLGETIVPAVGCMAHFAEIDLFFYHDVPTVRHIPLIQDLPDRTAIVLLSGVNNAYSIMASHKLINAPSLQPQALLDPYIERVRNALTLWNMCSTMLRNDYRNPQNVFYDTLTPLNAVGMNMFAPSVEFLCRLDAKSFALASADKEIIPAPPSNFPGMRLH